MSILQRPAKIATALVVLFLFYFIYEHTGWQAPLQAYEIPPKLPDTPQSNDVPSEPVKDEAAQNLGQIGQDEHDVLPSIPPADLLSSGQDTVPPTVDLSNNEATLPDRWDQLSLNAHKLEHADAFLPHFKEIAQVEGMTMVEAKSSCTWTAEDNVNFQYETDDWIKNEKNDTELETRRKQWQEFITNSNNELLPWEKYKDRFSGRGIVIVAGNGKTIKRVKVILRQMERLKSTLPIEIQYWDQELNDTTKAELTAMWPEKLFFNDLSSEDNVLKTSFSIFQINWQLKTAAIMNSRFAEPLLLDSDNIPVIDPAELYESDTYKEYGTLFWPDIARTRPQNPMWAITNTRCRMDEFEQESGQVIVDKRKYFYHLQLAAWFNNVHGKYYNTFLLGDKDMFRFTWHALKTKFGKPPKWLTSVGTVNEGNFCGHSFAQHAPDGRVAFLHGGLLKTMQTLVMQWHRKDHGGIWQAYKRSKYDEQHSQSVHVRIKWDGVLNLPNRPEDLSIASCTDIFDEEPRPLDEILPGWESVYEEIGGYWRIDGLDSVA